MIVETAKSAVKAICVLHNYLRTKSCDSKYYGYLEPSEPVRCALIGLGMEVRRGQNVAFHTRQQFTVFFN